jgi:4-hydroxy-tetrahydrodipicolinate synthase
MFPGSSLVPVVTPFKESLEIDYEAFKRLLLFQIESGSDGVICFGTTGEGELLSHEEKLTLFKVAMSVVDGRIPVFASVSSPSTHYTIALALEVKNLGASGLLCTPPFFVRPEKEGLLMHFSKLDKVGLPIILYHSPYRTGITLPFEVLNQILFLEKVIGVKECSGDLKLVRALSLFFEKKILFSGNDLHLFEEIKEGMQASIPAIGNIIPKEWKKIISFQDNTLYNNFIPLLQAVYKEVNPQGIKSALSKMGLISNYLRLPLVPASLETANVINKMVEDLVIGYAGLSIF